MSAALKTQQREFMAQVLSEGSALPAGWSERELAGMQIYRSGYRARLVDVLTETFERCARLAGAQTFRQAAINHVIARPPSGWSLENASEGFDETLGDFAADRPELAELARIEHAMHAAAKAGDRPILTAQDFAAMAGAMQEEDWAGLSLEFTPALRVLDVGFDWPGVWDALGSEDAQGGAEAPQPLADQAALIIWREEERPVFMLAEAQEGEALQLMAKGMSFGALCEVLCEQLAARASAADDAEGPLAAAAAQLGQWLGRWLHMGLVSGKAVK
jgi:uncharacterized protein YoaH (UPF0181 family)